MLVYFEVHIDDANGYWIDNIKPENPTDLSVNPQYGFFLSYINGFDRDDYGIVMDLNCEEYNTDGDLKLILDKFKKDYLLELRKKKIEKLIDNQK